VTFINKPAAIMTIAISQSRATAQESHRLALHAAERIGYLVAPHRPIQSSTLTQGDGL
jgi:hypothetical protein